MVLESYAVFIFYFNFIDLREKEENSIDSLFYLLMHSLVDSYMCPEWGSNRQP